MKIRTCKSACGPFNVAETEAQTVNRPLRLYKHTMAAVIVTIKIGDIFSYDPRFIPPHYLVDFLSLSSVISAVKEREELLKLFPAVNHDEVC